MGSLAAGREQGQGRSAPPGLCLSSRKEARRGGLHTLTLDSLGARSAGLLFSRRNRGSAALRQEPSHELLPEGSQRPCLSAPHPALVRRGGCSSSQTSSRGLYKTAQAPAARGEVPRCCGNVLGSWPGLQTGGAVVWGQPSGAEPLLSPRGCRADAGLLQGLVSCLLLCSLHRSLPATSSLGLSCLVLAFPHVRSTACRPEPCACHWASKPSTSCPLSWCPSSLGSACR